MRGTSLVLLLSSILFAANSLRSHASAGGASAVEQGQAVARSGDAYIRQVGSTWYLGTAKGEKVLRLKDGNLFLVSFKNQVRHREYIQGPTDPLRFEIDGQMMTGSSERWTLAGSHTATLSQGELSLEIVLRNSTVEITERRSRSFPRVCWLTRLTSFLSGDGPGAGTERSRLDDQGHLVSSAGRW